MKWITREHPKIDRIACPWLILRFIDAHSEFHFVPAERIIATAQEIQAIPYDIPGVELTHVGKLCSFDALYAWCKSLQHETHRWPPAGFSLAS